MNIKLHPVTYSLIGIAILASASPFAYAAVKALPTFSSFTARPPIHTQTGSKVSSTPLGMTPENIKTAYNLPALGGTGTIAIISAYKHPSIESDLAVFDKQFSLPDCTLANKCLEVHAIGTSTKIDAGWSLESALDTEWAHAIAPNAKILVVEAASTKGSDLIKAVDYARNRKDVVSVSMSWGGDEFSDETTLDKHFTNKTPVTTIRDLNNEASTSISSTSSADATLNAAKTSTKAAIVKYPTYVNNHGITFFAASGDDGNGASWPAVSPNVIAVGGTTLTLDSTGHMASEKAWTGSGGGVSAYETEPSYQITYSIPRTNNKRAIPDVSYAADPAHGFSVYHMETVKNKSAKELAKGWYVVGGTSAGAPQWAALQALSGSISLATLYKDKASPDYSLFFRDIVSGNNGTCTYYCAARAHYDYVTGLGSPITDKF